MGSNYIITSSGAFINIDDIYHSGIKGMKWGVRRYQNPDGSLTPAGKKRYSNDVSNMSTDELRQKVNRMYNEQRYIDLTKSSSSAISKTTDYTDQATKIGRDVTKTYKSVKGDKDPYGKMANQGIDIASRTSKVVKKIDTTARDKRDTKTARKNLEKMSDKELAEKVERLDLERQYSRLRESDVRRGKVRVNDVLDIAGDIVAIGASAVAIAVGIQKLTKK